MGWSKLLSIVTGRTAEGGSVRVSWGKLATLILGVAITGYLFLASSLYFYTKYLRGVHQTSYFGPALP